MGVEVDMYNIIASCIYITVNVQSFGSVFVYSSVECSQLQWMLDDRK